MKKYGRYSLVKELSATHWLVRCLCGTEKAVIKYGLIKGDVVSCGCHKRDLLNAFNKTHGLSGTRPYRIWNGMKQRCSNPSRSAYKYYGGRGITYDLKWKTFNGFWEDMQDGYKDNLEIDRIDNSANYSKKNCHWITHSEQLKKQTHIRRVAIDGITLSLKEWCKKLGMNIHTVEARIRKQGLSPKEALTKPLHLH